MKKLILFMVIFMATTIGYAGDLTEHADCKGKEHPESITFNAEFFEPILSRRKIATTRKGIRCYKVGQIIDAMDTNGKNRGRLKITSVEERHFSNLDEKLAKDEDTTLADLREGLVSIYGDIIKTVPLSVIYFKLL